MTIQTKPPAVADAPRRLIAESPKRVMSRADCEALFKRIVAFTSGGGDTEVSIRGTWTANLRWARNRPTTSGDTLRFTTQITRSKPGKRMTAELDQLDDATLKEVVQLLEQQLVSLQANTNWLPELGPQTYLTPAIWDDATFAMTPKDLSDAVRMSVDPVVDAKLDAVGYAEVSAATWAIFNTTGLAAHAVATGALYTQTVRNMAGKASGWAGGTHMSWQKLDAKQLSAAALQHCIKSTHPRAVEPGRYTAILEPDIVGRMMSWAVEAMDRDHAETGETVYTDRPSQGSQRGTTKLGQRVFDSRITITSDPTDPECGYMPFDPIGVPYRKVTWVENGILKALSYNRTYAQQILRTNEALPNPQAFRVSGGPTTVEEMIAGTERGIYVTNTTGLTLIDRPSLSLTAMTRNGLWLVEQGKIVQPIENFWFNESPMLIFNQVEALGPAVRTYGSNRRFVGGGGVWRNLPSRALNEGRVPIVVPPMKVKDFNFTRLSEAI